MRYVLDFRERETGGAVVPGKLSTTSGLQGPNAELELKREPRVVFLLHGFNVDRSSGHAGLLRLANHLPSAQDEGVVATLWPGDHWVGPLSYSFEGRDADDTADYLSRFIADILDVSTPVSFVSHSLGARVVMGAVERLEARGRPVDQVCLMAPAIDDFSLASTEDYREAVETTSRVAVLASREDTVLKWAYPAGDLLQAFVFFWRESYGLALGYHGPKPDPDDGAVPARVAHEQIPDERQSGHGDYVPEVDPTAEQLSAAAYADGVISGQSSPSYP